MAKMFLNAFLRPRREGIEAEVAEFPDIKVSALSSQTALARLREAVWHRFRWTKVETSCSGEPITPVPQKSQGDKVAVPLEVVVTKSPQAGGASLEGWRPSLADSSG
jgi:hypothetical protein